MKTLTTALSATMLMAGTALAGDIQTRTVTFENEGATLTGTLYLPASHQDGERRPTVIVTGAWTTVQEQMPRE